MSLGHLHEKLSGSFQMKPRLFISRDWWINLFSFTELNVPQVQNRSHNAKNCILETIPEKIRSWWLKIILQVQLNFSWWSYLLFRTDPNDIHSLSCCMIFLSIVYTLQCKTLGLVEIVVCLRITKFELLNILAIEKIITEVRCALVSSYFNGYYKKYTFEMMKWNLLLQVQHKACRNNGSFFQGQTPGKHAIFPANKFL